MLLGEVSYCRIQGATWYVGVGPDHVPLNGKQVAKKLGVSTLTLGKWRWENKGPEWVKVERTLPDKRAVDEWIESGKK
jgi:hypothetical protein